MMEDKIEKFIRDHRDAFDDLKAPSRVWARIDKRNGPQVHHLWKWSAVAASGLLLIAVGYIFGMKNQSQPAIAGWNEFEEAEQYYETRIHQKMEQIKTLPVGEEVLSDIKILDEVYEQLRRQLTEDPNANAEVLLAAMIRHQKQKLEVMDEILNRVDKYKSNETNPNHEM